MHYISSQPCTSFAPVKNTKNYSNSNVKKKFNIQNMNADNQNLKNICTTKYVNSISNLLKNNILNISLMKILYCIFVITIILPNAKSIENFDIFVSQPKLDSYFVKENTSGLLISCVVKEQFKNRSRYEMEWTKVINGTPITVSRNSELFDQKAYSLEENIDNGTYNLRLNTVDLKHDNGNFFCKLVDLENRQSQFVSNAAQIVVVVRPSQPTIILEPQGPVEENQLITIECSTFKGNPSPKFKWLFDNGTVVPSSWVQERYNTFTLEAVSIVKWRVSYYENGAYLICNVYNEALEDNEILNIRTNALNVQYAPQVTIGPLSIINVEEGESIELNCQANANPKASFFTWKHFESKKTHNESNWRFLADRQLSGDYICNATNGLYNGIGKLYLNVLYPPVIKIKSIGTSPVFNSLTNPKIEVTENDELLLECDVEANPPADRVWWTGPNEILQNGTRLRISKIHRSFVGNFTCFATNTFIGLYVPLIKPSTLNQINSEVRTSRSSIYVDVRRKPGNSIIKAHKTVVEIGQKIILTCTTNDIGYPPAKYYWETPNGWGSLKKSDDLTNTPELIIENAKLIDNGRYKCVAYNQVGEGKEAVSKIVVVYPSRITRPLKSIYSFVAGDVENVLSCEAEGYPQPKLEWYKDNLLIENFSTVSNSVQKIKSRFFIEEKQKFNCKENETCIRTTVSTLRFFNPIEWFDKGNYECQTFNNPKKRNSINKSLITSSLTQVQVFHKPVILNTRHENLVLAAANIGSTTRLACIVSAKPEPTIVWLRNGQVISSNDEPHYQIQTARLFRRIDEYDSSLIFHNVADYDFGKYTCEAKNSANNKKTSVEFFLQLKSQPYVPKKLRLLKKDKTWGFISWQGSFDGGESQSFELEFFVVDFYNDEELYGNKEKLFEVKNNVLQKYRFDINNLTTMKLFEIEKFLQDKTTFNTIKKKQNYISSTSIAETFYVFNITNLRPMSKVLFRVRAINILGASKWSEINSFITLDAPSVGINEIDAPESIEYVIDKKKLIVQHFKTIDDNFFNTSTEIEIKNINDNLPTLCTLVYVSTKNLSNWISVGCFSQLKTLFDENNKNVIVLQNIEPAERFRVRFCFKNDLTLCSNSVETYVDMSAFAMIPSWKILLIVGVSTIVLAVFVFLMLFCCRRCWLLSRFSSSSTTTTSTLSSMSSKKKLKKRLNLNGAVVVDKYNTDQSLPKMETQKNTIIHGSQNDSGVFTLASSTHTANNGLNSTGSNNSGSSENWRQPMPINHCLKTSSFDLNNEPYLQEFHNLHGIVALENGLAADELSESQKNYKSLYFRPSQIQQRRASLCSNNFHSVVNMHPNGNFVHSNSEEHTVNNAILVSNGGNGIDSNEKLVVTSANGSDSASYNDAVNNASCRIMREIIV